MNKQKGLNGKSILIRSVCRDDCEDIWMWRNDPKVRRNSFSQAEILLVDHQKWFNEKLKDRNTVMYILEEYLGEKIGQVRFQIVLGNAASISVNLNPSYIGRGLGTYVIAEATRTLLKENPLVNFVQAEILEENNFSQKAFSKAGYSLQREEVKQGKKIVVYCINRLGIKG